MLENLTKNFDCGLDKINFYGMLKPMDKIENKNRKEETKMAKVILSIIILIESGGNPLAFNKKSGAMGLCQIRKICLDDYNLYHPHNAIRPQDLFTKKYNLKVAGWYLNHRIPQLLKHYGIKDTIDNRLWAYNAGFKKVVMGVMPVETEEYIRRYHKIEKGGE